MTQTQKRETWLDVLRILSAFLVIVNHTNSRVFQGSDPAQAQWWLSMAWYYLCKMAVPLFVMISGACLLGKQDSWKRALQRAGRALAALVVFSYLYFLHDCWVNFGLWPRALRLDLVLSDIWQQQVADSFWYLYFYIGLMLMLPLLQRMAHGMQKRDYLWLMGLCLLVDGVFPLAAHYAPQTALPVYLQTPLLTGYLGLFFAGHFIRSQLDVTPRLRRGAVLGLVVCVGLSLCLTYGEFFRVEAGEPYWFMDDRLHPSLFTCLSSLCLMILLKDVGQQASVKAQKLLCNLGCCSFGIYLLQEWVIQQTAERLYQPLCQALSPFPAVLVWEGVVFLVCLAAAWVMRRIPGLKRLV